MDSRQLTAIYTRGSGSVFVPAGREAVDVALHRLARKGSICRLPRWVYDFRKQDPVLGTFQPSPDAVASALAGRDRTRLQPAGASAANGLALSGQVPAKFVFLTDGPIRTVKVGLLTIQPIQLRRTNARNMAAAGRLSSLLIQALGELGKEHVTPERLAHLNRTLRGCGRIGAGTFATAGSPGFSPFPLGASRIFSKPRPAQKRQELITNIRLAQAWMRPIFRKLMGTSS